MYIASSVNIHLYLCLMVLVCPVCIFLGVISNQSTSKKPCHLCQTFNTFEALLHKTYSKALLILRYQGSTSLGQNDMLDVA